MYWHFVAAGESHKRLNRRLAQFCRAALPLEEERADPRRLSLLWELLAIAANFQMQNDNCFDAFEQALHYRRLAGDSPSDTGIDWSLILGSRRLIFPPTRIRGDLTSA